MPLWLLDHIGLTKPYRFGRLLVVLSAVVLAMAAGAAIVSYRLTRELDYATPRSWYFLYVLVLLGLALLAARWPRYAAVALSLATLELGLGVGSDVLERGGYAYDDLLPTNEGPQAARTWHPLLQEAVKPGAVHQLGNSQIRYNSQGLRGPERSAEDLRGKRVIALFGGSTTEDALVPDGKSWGEQLEEILGSRFVVINHGSAWYSTVQLVLLTAFYERAFGVEPTCSVYYTGGVDMQNSHFRDLDPGYANFHAPALVDAPAVRRVDDLFPSISPTLRYVGRLVVLAVDTVRPALPPDGEASGAPDPKLEAIFARNVRTISAINRQRGIKTIWIGEVMDAATLAEQWSIDEPWAPFVPGTAVVPLLLHLNSILQREAAALGDVYIDLRAKEFTRRDFVDGEHFSVQGSLKFATLVAPKIGDTCRH
jgi:hypothetical protein